MSVCLTDGHSNFTQVANTIGEFPKLLGTVIPLGDSAEEGIRECLGGSCEEGSRRESRNESYGVEDHCD